MWCWSGMNPLNLGVDRIRRRIQELFLTLWDKVFFFDSFSDLSEKLQCEKFVADPIKDLVDLQ